MNIGGMVGGSTGTVVGGMASSAFGPQLQGALSALGVSGAIADVMAMLGLGRGDPEVGYRYFIEIDGIQVVRFTKASGMKMTTKVMSIREGGNNVHEHQLIEGQTFSPLVIERGFYSRTDELYNWMKGLHGPDPIERKSIALVCLNDMGSEVCRWSFSKAFIEEYEGPGFDSKGKEIAFEKMKIRYDYFDFEMADLMAMMAQNALSSGMAALSNAL